MAKAKQTVKKDTMSKLVEFVAAHQNDKKKLNAGQIREMVSLVVIGIGVHLEKGEINYLHDYCETAPLAQKIKKQNAIAFYEAELKALKELV